MSIMLTEVYDALRAAEVPEGVARDAAHALGEITTDVRLLKWMVSAIGGLTLVVLGAVAGLYVVLFNLAMRLPH
jgi:hypothetical protein